MEALQSENTFVEQIPVEGFEMTYIKDNAVALSDGAFIQRVSLYYSKQIIGALTRVRELLHQVVTDKCVALRGWHLDLLTCWQINICRRRAQTIRGILNASHAERRICPSR